MSKRYAALLVSVANGLSLFRLLAVPGLVYLIWRMEQVESSRYAAFWLIAFLHLGDMVDGHLARTGSRQLAVRNYFGEVIDPIADKMYIGAAFVTLGLTGHVQVWFATLVVARDVAIIGGWTYVYKRFNVRLLPNMPGKLTDFCSAALLAFILLDLGAATVGIATQVATGLILYSGYAYYRMAADTVSTAERRRRREAAAARRRGGHAGNPMRPAS